MSLNKNSVYCVMPRSSEPPDTCKWGGNELRGILKFSRIMSIVLCLDLPSLPTNVSDRVFCSLDEGKKSCNEKHLEFENFNLLKYKARTSEPPQEARFKRLAMANMFLYVHILHTVLGEGLLSPLKSYVNIFI